MNRGRYSSSMSHKKLIETVRKWFKPTSHTAKELDAPAMQARYFVKPAGSMPTKIAAELNAGLARPWRVDAKGRQWCERLPASINGTPAPPGIKAFADADDSSGMTREEFDRMFEEKRQEVERNLRWPMDEGSR